LLKPNKDKADMTPPDPDQVIPFERLPAGFADRLEAPPSPATPRPAATVVLVREAGEGPQVLLLRRTRSAGFVPGAFVFPGGRVDSADAHPEVLERIRGVEPGEVDARLGAHGVLDVAGEGAAGGDMAGKDVAGRDVPSGAAFLVAALREAFEETGIPVFRRSDDTPLGCAAGDPEMERLRRALLAGELTFLEVLREVDGWMDGSAVGYISHWITPEAEPRRYDTRFFAAAVARGTPALVDDQEITEAVWLTPAEALARNRQGTLPMVFPTVKTLEALRSFVAPGEILEHYRNREIPAILPHFVRTPTGVGIRIPEDGSGGA
jgi:8-oxo-dGTP pyrophosphatase MutT (NUDIX family)